MTRRIRTLVNGRYFAQIEARLTVDEKQRLEGLLQVEEGRKKSPLHAIKRLLDNPGEAAALGRRARERCETRYSFRVARAVLFPLLDRLTPKPS